MRWILIATVIGLCFFLLAPFALQAGRSIGKQLKGATDDLMDQDDEHGLPDKAESADADKQA